jgi:prepilin-type N-terminal cleavage/methylation domain-containing protein
MTFLHLHKGLTLIELCVTMSIAAIITVSTASYAPSLIQTRKSDSTINELFQLFSLARTEAITRSSIVTICPLNRTGRCSNNWDTPISVFQDPDNSRSLTHNEVIIRQTESHLSGSLKAAPLRRRYFQFDSLGESKGTLGNLTYCAKTGDPKYTRRLIVTFSGRTRLAQDTNLDGQVEDADGTPVYCNQS